MYQTRGRKSDLEALAKDVGLQNGLAKNPYGIIYIRERRYKKMYMR